MKEAWTLINYILKYPLPIFWGLAIAAAFWWLRRQCYLRVPPQQVAVIFNRKKGNFKGFLRPGRYLLVPFLELNQGSISTESATARSSCEVDTRDGRSLVLQWVLTYRLDPWSIDATLQPAMAGILLSTPTRMAEVHMSACLKKVAQRYTLETIQRTGLASIVNAQCAHSINPCLAAYGILVEKIQVTPLLPAGSSTEFEPQDHNSRRLSEAHMARLAEPHPSLLNRTRSKTSPAHTLAASPANITDQRQKQDPPQENGYYHAMALDISQNAEVPHDLSIGKLVI